MGSVRGGNPRTARYTKKKTHTSLLKKERANSGPTRVYYHKNVIGLSRTVVSDKASGRAELLQELQQTFEDHIHIAKENQTNNHYLL